MKRRRLTIAGWMVLMVFAAINAALARAFFVDLFVFEGLLLPTIAFQVGLAGVLLGRGRARRFWMGFDVAVVLGVLALIAAEVPGTTWSRWVGAYVNAMARPAFLYLPDPVIDFIDEDQTRLFAVIYFLPILLAAIVGGTLTALANRPRPKSKPRFVVDRQAQDGGDGK